MAKILIDARESGTSTGRYIDKLVEYLHKIKTPHEFAVLTSPSRVEFINQIAPKFDVVPTIYKEFTFAEQIDLLRQVKKQGADLVHFGMTQQPIMYKGKVVTTMHDLTTTRYRNPTKNWLVFTVKQIVYKWLAERVAHKSSAIITPTEWVKDDVARFAGANSRKIIVTHEAADKITDKVMPIEDLKDKKFILYVGRPNTHKNLDRLVAAHKQVLEQHPDVYLVFAGKRDALYRKMARRANKRVMFRGFVEEGELRWLYENAMCYVFPSLSEGFGLPGLEAMIHGLPVVSSNATCLPEVYGDAVAYFDPESVDDMAATINKVLSSDKFRKSLISKGKAQVAKYSWKRMAEQTLEVYNQVLNDEFET